MGFQQNLGGNPLDKWVDFIGAIQQKKDNIAGRKERLKYALNLKGKAKERLLSKLQDCGRRGCKGKRGGECKNCGSKIL